MHSWTALTIALAIAIVPDIGRSQHTAALVPDQLSQLLEAGERTPVLVLGTAHLAHYGPADSITAALPHLLTELERYHPEVICIEALSSTAIAELEGRQDDPAVVEVLEAFAGDQRARAAAIQRARGLDARTAQHRADSALVVPGRRSPEQTRELVADLLAAQDPYSAMLHATDAQLHTPPSPLDSLITVLRAERRGLNEIVSIGAALAERVGVQRLHAVDDHCDDVLLLPHAERLMQELETTTAYRALLADSFYSSSDSAFAQAVHKGDLYPYYAWLNSPAYAARDMDLQWGLFLRTALPSGSDRFRFSTWEMRNLRIAANIMEVLARNPGKRTLVLIGAAHAPFLASYLGTMADVRLIISGPTASNDIPSKPRQAHAVDPCRSMGSGRVHSFLGSLPSVYPIWSMMAVLNGANWDRPRVFWRWQKQPPEIMQHIVRWIEGA